MRGRLAIRSRCVIWSGQPGQRRPAGREDTVRRPLIAAAAATLAAPLVAVGSATAGASGAAPPAAPAPAAAAEERYVVVYAGDAAAARAALARLGARLVRENAAVGVATVTTRNARFAAEAAGERSLFGVASDRVIGTAGTGVRKAVSGLARERAESAAGPRTAAALAGAAVPGDEPLAVNQWDMRMIRATRFGSYRVEPGNRGVLVGIIDTGIQGSHADIAPNFHAGLSRNFTVDIPFFDPGDGSAPIEIDGPCEVRSCIDPPDVDDNGHGTHVASTVAAPLNGTGIGGVAPNVRLVNLRAGQDSGYFFLQPTIDAMTYAADVGVDVVNMSYFTDPWLFNCRANPADSPQEQAQQRTVIEATQRAANYARSRGVTLVAAAGNEATDLGHPTTDTISPDYPPAEGVAKTRTITNRCITVPTETDGVIAVSAVGRTGVLSYFSNYGVEQTTVAAPGGDRRLFFGTPYYNAPNTRVLGAYPRHVAEAAGLIDEDGRPTDPILVRDCSGGRCGYYIYFQGTSMAAPHAVGVAALIVSRYGRPDRVRGGLTLAPGTVQRLLQSSATDRSCPRPNPYTYEDPELADYHPFCAGNKAFNGFYGHGIVDALRAVSPSS
jgi:subtilisin family serine protease